MKKWILIGVMSVPFMLAGSALPALKMLAYNYRPDKPFMTIHAFGVPFFNGRNLIRSEIDKSVSERYFHEYSFSGGLDLGFYVNRHLILETGCWYSPRYYMSEMQGTYNGGLGIIKTRYIPTYLSFPVSLKITTREKISPFFRIGGIADMITSLRTESNYYGSATAVDMESAVRKKEDFEKLRYSLFVSMGITLGKNRQSAMNFLVEPVFLFSLTPDSKAGTSAYKPFYFGIRLSLGYVFMRKGKEEGMELPPDYMEEAPAEEDAE